MDEEGTKKIDTRRLALSTVVMFPLLLSAALMPCATAHASTISEMYRTRAVIPLSERDYPQAMELLDLAVAADAEDAQAWYYRGLVNSRRGHYSDAARDLEAASALGFAYPELFFELGYVYFRLQRYPEARKSLRRALAAKPAAESVANVRALLARVEQQARRERAFQLELSAGIMRDSNVGLHPDDTFLPGGLEQRGDNRWQVALDGKWKPEVFEGAPLTLGYRFFQSLHQQLDQFDLRHHALIADWRQKRDAYIWGVNYQYSQASLDNDDYVKSHRLLPSLMLYHGRERASLLKFTWRHDRYEAPRLDAFDGNRYQADYRHYWVPTDNRYHYLGALLNRKDADDASLAFSASGVTAGLLSHWQNIRVTADLQYQRKHYPDSPLDRDDDYYKADLIMRYPLTPHLLMDVSANRIRNRSDAALFDYSRTLYGVTLRWQL
jgi:tetratricopeptide (TPR) repeat protein